MYLCTKLKFSPIFFWVSKFDVKFQNLMSSWGSWSKISKLEQVRDFSFGGCKSSRVPTVVCDQEPTDSLRGPPEIYTTSREAASLMGRMGRMGR